MPAGEQWTWLGAAPVCVSSPERMVKVERLYMQAFVERPAGPAHTPQPCYERQGSVAAGPCRWHAAPPPLLPEQLRDSAKMEVEVFLERASSKWQSGCSL